MSDRSGVTLIVAACPDTYDAKRALFDVIEENTFQVYVDTPGAGFALGDAMYADDVSLGAEDEIRKALEPHGIAFDVFQDAKYEYDGAGWCVVAGVGAFAYQGGGSGTRMVETRAVNVAIEYYHETLAREATISAPDSRTMREVEAAAGLALAEDLAKLTGAAHERAFKLLIDALPEDVADRFVADPGYPED